MITEASGVDVEYTPVIIKAYRNGLEKAGLPEPVVDISMVIAESIAAGEFDYTDSALENLLGRKPLDMKKFIENSVKS